MYIYTKQGDKGMTNLYNGRRVPKSDKHIEVLGNIDELSSAMGFAKSELKDEALKAEVTGIQQNLQDAMSIVAGGVLGEKSYGNDTEFLEKRMDIYQQLFPKLDRFVIPGESTTAVRFDMARTIARRTERSLSGLNDINIRNSGIGGYFNRLSDYLFTTARMIAFREQVEEALGKTTAPAVLAGDINGIGTLSLTEAKAIAEKVEQEAMRLGVNVVISLANKDGTPILCHMMDDAFLISYGLANKKAYTSASLKMPTHELKKLTRAGADFAGLEDMVEEKIVTLGGGYPIISGGKARGAIGVSGSSVDNDIYLAAYGADATERKSI